MQSTIRILEFALNFVRKCDPVPEFAREKSAFVHRKIAVVIAEFKIVSYYFSVSIPKEEMQ